MKHCKNSWFSILIVVILLAPFSLPSAASDLYRADVLVNSQSAGERLTAFTEAIRKVLVKISGARSIANVTEVATLIDKAPQYVQSYSYGRKINRVNPSATAAGDMFINVQFNGAALEKALRQAALPVWSANRPLVMTWLAVQDSGKQYIVSQGSDSDIKYLLEEAAAERGIRLIFPLMDIEDRDRVKFADIRGGFVENLRSASKRYDATIALSGYLRVNRNGQASVKWAVNSQININSEWQKSRLPIDSAISLGVNELADLLAAKYAFTPDGGLSNNVFLVAVDGVQSANDYAQVRRYLEQLVFVNRVMPVEVQGNQVHYNVAMQGQLSELERALTLSNIVVPAVSGDTPLSFPANAPAPNMAQLYFKLQR